MKWGKTVFIDFTQFELNNMNVLMVQVRDFLSKHYVHRFRSGKAMTTGFRRKNCNLRPNFHSMAQYENLILLNSFM